jgi:predicted DNA-binding transcriptional regulator AlpA
MQTASRRRERLLTKAEVVAMTGLPVSSIYLLMRATEPKLQFPKPLKIGERSRWLETEVQAWIRRQAQRTRGA